MGQRTLRGLAFVERKCQKVRFLTFRPIYKILEHMWRAEARISEPTRAPSSSNPSLPTKTRVYRFHRVWRRGSIMFLKYRCVITKTFLYNIDPLKHHFYIVKLGFTGVYITFLISAQNIDWGYSLEPHHRGDSNEYPQSMFWADIWNIWWSCKKFCH